MEFAVERLQLGYDALQFGFSKATVLVLVQVLEYAAERYMGG
jgi:hypothetical protein